LDGLYTSLNLSFVIKIYDAIGSGKKVTIPLSKRLNIEEIGSEFKIDGPFGRGLELSPGIEGDFVMISAGTGFLPFADLIDF